MKIVFGSIQPPSNQKGVVAFVVVFPIPAVAVQRGSVECHLQVQGSFIVNITLKTVSTSVECRTNDARTMGCSS